ncbi:uncharacterized protein BP5553_01442 [Venustampulla echinocandica]|uniref:BHLH domain-containing protein n=1 Tax=Venustampulla echinocandica TaxID=2656787 RepID=A0A370U138_9HELO|nr:uncharacterized protein BP5553_01442 [Venustampulla echinocandica]RDL41463.1 hypothetical protein BP5553_01442 [Venustampulla echinocandica]
MLCTLQAAQPCAKERTLALSPLFLGGDAEKEGRKTREIQRIAARQQPPPPPPIPPPASHPGDWTIGVPLVDIAISVFPRRPTDTRSKGGAPSKSPGVGLWTLVAGRWAAEVAARFTSAPVAVQTERLESPTPHREDEPALRRRPGRLRVWGRPGLPLLLAIHHIQHPTSNIQHPTNIQQYLEIPNIPITNSDTPPLGLIQAPLTHSLAPPLHPASSLDISKAQSKYFRKKPIQLASIVLSAANGIAASTIVHLETHFKKSELPMASSIISHQRPTAVGPDPFSLNRQRIHNDTSIAPAFSWDSNPYNDPALVSSDSCESTLPSPTSPSPIIYPGNPYSLPKDDSKSEQAFNFDSFEDWMRWDDPSDPTIAQATNFFPDIKAEPSSPTMEELELQGSGIGSFGTCINSADECVVFGGDAFSEEPLFESPTALIQPPVTDLPPRENLYSTPLSWSRPLPTAVNPNSYSGRLSPQQESRLREIAMPSRSPSNKMEYPASPSLASSPEPCTNNRRKRKTSIDEDAEDSPTEAVGNKRHPPVKKTAHNMIEKRYRTNLNDKIAALRDSVPSLRVMSKKNSRGEEIEEDLQGLTPAHKLNKATVLSKATEYIAHLEKRNKYLAKENSALKARVDAFEILVMSRQQAVSQQRPRGSMSNMPGESPIFNMDGMVS